MGVKWTEEQQQVIDLRDHNILVSAAAGSGKTAVLVERIIARLTRDANPVDVDHMLIVTYTEAAAAEMKERIGAAIEKELEEDPSSEHLKRQSALIHTAKITTIHSFCLSVIREYFHTIDLDPGFRIAEEGELKLLKQDVMKELLEAKYEEGNEDFLRFVETFATGREDLQVEEIISRLYEFAGSYPDPEEWLDDCARMYEESGEKAFLSGKEALFAVLQKENIPILTQTEFDEKTGNEIILTVDYPADKIKELTTELEENHPFGRLFDMDVIGTDGEKLSRGVYRKCLICGCQAQECARSRKHTVAEMQAKIEEMLS